MSNLRAFDYDVALSFAGEDRVVAEELAGALAQRGVRVFYDQWERADLWGKDLYRHLTDVYGKAARFCIVIVSRDYIAKAWTNHELRSAQARAFREHAEYILPVRLDDTEVPGLPGTIGYLDLRNMSVAELASLLLQKLEIAGAPSLGESPVETPTRSSSAPFRVPRLPPADVDAKEDAESLIAHVERVLDARVPVLERAGLTVIKEAGADASRTYRIKREGLLLYFLRMRVGSSLFPHAVSFLDGWTEPASDHAATAFAEVRRTIADSAPTAVVTNFSLLDARGVSVTLAFDGLAELIWDKACNVVESMINRGN